VIITLTPYITAGLGHVMAVPVSFGLAVGLF
jgi:hypothetical protein